MNNTMVYLAVDKDGTECIFEFAPARFKGESWYSTSGSVELPKGTIKKLTGKDLTFDDGYRTYVGDDPTPG